MKILIVSYNPLPYPGGIWTFVSRLMMQLEKRGHQVDIFSLNNDTLNYRMIGQTEELIRTQAMPGITKKILSENPGINQNNIVFHAESSMDFMGKCALHYGLGGYDIIYAQDAIAAKVISPIKPPSTPLVMSAHGYLSGEIYFYLKDLGKFKKEKDVYKSSEYQYFRRVEHEGYHASDLIHAQSTWMRNIIVDQFQVPADKVRFFPYGMETDKFEKSLHVTRAGLQPAEKKVILFTGRLVQLKGLPCLLDALGELKARRQDWVCWILGEGNMMEQLEVQTRRLGLKGFVQLKGLVPDVRPYLNSADIFVLPGLQDTQPHAVMEAQLSGLPVIVSNAAGLPDMVEHGVNGLIFTANDSLMLSRQLYLLLDQDAVRKQMGDRAKEWARKMWSIDSLLANILSMFKEASGQKSSH